MKRKRRPRSKTDQAVLTAFDAAGVRVRRQVLAIHDYYDDVHNLIDSDAYRAHRKIRRIRGELFDGHGQRYQYWENFYSARGRLTLSRVTHSDGSIEEQDHRAGR